MADEPRAETQDSLANIGRERRASTMSPGRVIEHADQDRHLETLARGFDALLVTVQILSCKEQELQRRLKYSHEEVRSLASVHLPIPPPHPPVSNDEKIRLALDRESHLRR